MSNTMKAVMKVEAAPGAKVVDVDIPKIKNPDDILVKIKATSICGTDAHIYFWDEWAAGRIKPPMIFGHEFAGEVLEVGSHVKGIKVGDHVSAETHIPCNVCYQCKTGLQHICHNLKILGVDTNGCFAEYAVIPEICAWKNEKSLPWEIASIQEPFGNAMYTVDESNVSGKEICVIGDGPIAAFATGIARAFGATKIFCVGKHKVRMDILKKMGADILVNRDDDVVKIVKDGTHGQGVDVVLEMCGAQKAIDQGLQMVKKGGVFTAFGIPTGKVSFDLAGGVVFKGSKIIGINGRKMFDTWYKVANLLGSGRIDVKPVITHKFKLTEFDKAMSVMKSDNRDADKVVLIP